MGDSPKTKPALQGAEVPPAVAGGQSNQSHAAQSPRQHADLQFQYPHGPSPIAFSSQFDMAQSSVNRAPAFNMSGMASALPQVAYAPSYGHGGQPQPSYSPAPGSTMATPMPQPPQYAVQMSSQAFYPQQAPTVQSYYPVPVYQAHPAAGTLHPRPNVVFHQAQGSPSPHHQATQVQPAVYYYPAASPYPPQGHPSSNPLRQYAAYPAPAIDPRMVPPPTGSDPRIPSVAGHELPLKPTNVIGESELADGRQSIVRGPPRKPKQRGHAIWIGNLPPHTDLMSLVSHVCKEAPGLESLFLISKSNCAFANFKDEQTCVSAQQKLHDSRFQSVRLVSRLRKTIAERPGGGTYNNTEETTSTPSSTPASEAPASEGSDGEHLRPVSTTVPSPAKLSQQILSDGRPEKERYFVLKSLTVEDLEMSVRNGIWATQSHNEETLNVAFKSADSVYLVFSANKSGEYFGYARMTSAINEDPAAAIEFAPSVQSNGAVDLPKAIPTDITEYAPKGRIIDDSARGTIFWEIERAEEDSVDEDDGDEESVAGVDGETDGPPKSWGKPFTLEWLSTARVPFYRTRGLRNPWNANREVKIARDGTELEPSVGRRLIGLFNMVQSPGLVPPGIVRAGVGMMRYPQPQTRPYS